MTWWLRSPFCLLWPLASCRSMPPSAVSVTTLSSLWAVLCWSAPAWPAVESWSSPSSAMPPTLPRSAPSLTGTPFTMFDFTPVGLALTASGVVFLCLFYWLVPARTRQSASLHEALDIKDYIAEAKVVADSVVIDKQVADVLKIAGGEVIITSILRSGTLRIAPLPDAVLHAGDVLLIEGDHEALDRLVAQAGLRLSDRPLVPDTAKGQSMVIEAVVGENSGLIGWTAQHLLLYDRFNVNLAAGFAESLGYRPEAFLMAVAIGGGCDFLTPIRHQCNTLVMGPGGYRFSDYPRLGLPLSLLVIVAAVPALMIVWPMR
jgi:di/tricarboxylate transporter